jgi:hypothetical protein
MQNMHFGTDILLPGNTIGKQKTSTEKEEDFSFLLFYF